MHSLQILFPATTMGDKEGGPAAKNGKVIESEDCRGHFCSKRVRIRWVGGLAIVLAS